MTTDKRLTDERLAEIRSFAKHHLEPYPDHLRTPTDRMVLDLLDHIDSTRATGGSELDALIERLRTYYIADDIEARSLLIQAKRALVDQAARAAAAERLVNRILKAIYVPAAQLATAQSRDPSLPGKAAMQVFVVLDEYTALTTEAAALTKAAGKE